MHKKGILELVRDYGRYRAEGLIESADRELQAIDQALGRPGAERRACLTCQLAACTCPVGAAVGQQPGDGREGEA